MVALLTGGTVILEKSFAFPYRVAERLAAEKVTGFALVPTMAALLLQLEGLSKLDFHSLRYITNAAAALPVAHIRKLQRIVAQYQNLFHVWADRIRTRFIPAT